jgi:hypothetical protein
VARHVDPLLATRERTPEATALSGGAISRPLCADEKAKRGADTTPIVGRPPVLPRHRHRVRVGDPFQRARHLYACLPFWLVGNAIVIADLDDSVVKLE